MINPTTKKTLPIQYICNSLNCFFIKQQNFYKNISFIIIIIYLLMLQSCINIRQICSIKKTFKVYFAKLFYFFNVLFFCCSRYLSSFLRSKKKYKSTQNPARHIVFVCWLEFKNCARKIIIAVKEVKRRRRRENLFKFKKKKKNRIL